MGSSFSSGSFITEVKMKTSSISPLFWCCVVAAEIFASTVSDHRSIGSPDGKFTAEISSKEAQFTEETVTITWRGSGLRAEFPMTSKSGDNGRNVLKAEWSPDSKFFVFSTFSSGGHSSWNFQTYVYSVDSNKFVSVDEKVRPVTDERFQLISPHTLQVETLNPSGIDFPSFKRTVDLPTLFR